MEQYIDEFGNLQFREPSNNLPFKSMVDMAAENKNFMDQFNFPSANLNNVPVEISQLPIASVPNNFLNYRFQDARTPFTPIKEGIETLKSNVSSGIGKGIDLGKAAISGITSLVTGIPGLGLVLDAFQETPEQKAIKDFYAQNFGLTDTGQIASGIMQGYNPVYGFGGAGLQGAIDKRLATILKTEERKKKKGLELSQELINRRRELEALKERDRIAKLGANQGIGGFDPSGPTQASIRASRPDLSGKGQSGGFTNPGRGSYGPYS